MNRSYALAAAALAVPVLLAPAASADSSDDRRGSDKSQGTQVFRTQLTELNDSGATGKVQMHLRGTELTIRIKARGLLPNAVHAQHIHGVGNSECPTLKAADDNGDGVLNTVEGLPFYGPIVKSLTVKGDTSPDAALDVEIMPVADDKGRIDYRRTITLPRKVADNLGDFQIVQHGVDLNGTGEYDFGPGKSELNPAFPLEATVPANCGTISAAGDGHGHKH